MNRLLMDDFFVPREIWSEDLNVEEKLVAICMFSFSLHEEILSSKISKKTKLSEEMIEKILEKNLPFFNRYFRNGSEIEIIDSENETKEENREEFKKQQSGYVYFLQCDKYVKIGCTTNLANRIKVYGVKVPFRTNLVLAIKVLDCYYYENFIHELFGNKRAESEWFLLDQNDIELVKKILSNKENVSFVKEGVLY